MKNLGLFGALLFVACVVGGAWLKAPRPPQYPTDEWVAAHRPPEAVTMAAKHNGITAPLVEVDDAGTGHAPVVVGQPAEWSATGTFDTSGGTTTKAAVAGKSHYVTEIDVAMTGAATAPVLVQLKDGTTVIWSGYLPDPGGATATRLEKTFSPSPRKITAGAAVSVVVGTNAGAAVGLVHIGGYTR